MTMHVITKDSLDQLIELLKDDGFETIGPSLDGGAIVYDRIESLKDLPVGWGEEQEAGIYRLKKRGDQALFGYALGPTSWKKFLFPPSLKLWHGRRQGKDIQIEKGKKEKSKLAFVGVRSCDLHAIGIQDKVFLKGSFVDSHYQYRREDTLIIAVNCTEPGGTCFCASLQTGPKATAGFDLSLTEIIDKERHYFLVETGSPKGEKLLEALPHREARETERNEGKRLMDNALRKMGRTLDTANIKELLYHNVEHLRWDEVARRCLSCANCTLVCPTCFCSNVEDVTDLTGEYVERWRRWDSCFNLEFSYIHGGQVRHTTKGRYRQWMTHKLASWIDQFGSSGCVGCGRCITWCPVGIDITEEVKSIRETPLASEDVSMKKENS
jgi:ferredoxin